MIGMENIPTDFEAFANKCIKLDNELRSFQQRYNWTKRPQVNTFEKRNTNRFQNVRPNKQNFTNNWNKQ